MTAHGGARTNAGRPKGAAAKMNQEARTKAAEGGLMPLDYLLSILRDETENKDRRYAAAKDAAPYCHAKLSSVDANGNLDVTAQVLFQTIYGSKSN